MTEIFVAAYRPYVLGRLGELAIDAPARSWPNRSTTERNGCAALWRNCRPRPTGSAARARSSCSRRRLGTPPRCCSRQAYHRRTGIPVAASALPGDLYDLAPASSQSLGEEAWRAHLAWGAAKAAAVTSTVERRVLVVSANLLDRSRIESAIRAAGVSVAASLDAASPTRALVDLSSPGAIDRIEELADGGVDVIAFGPHVDTAALEAAAAAGATESLPRSIFFRRLDEIVRG